MTDGAQPGDRQEDPLLWVLAEHWDDIRALSDDEQRGRLRTLAADMAGPDAAEARAELADELLDLLPPEHPIVRVLRTGSMFLRPDAVSEAATGLPDTSTVAVTVYLSDERIHQGVEEAVEALLAAAGLQISQRDAPVTGSWFRRMAAVVKSGVNSPLARETAVTAAHAADTRLRLAQDAAVTATMLQNLPPLIGALHPTKDAVIRVGALLIVKVDWIVHVFQLTAAQQWQLDHQPKLASSPQEIMKALDLARPDASDGQVTGPSL
jgi:hypothetical protein